MRRIVMNAFSVLSSDAAARAATFVLYALVARYLGPFEFGQMSLALAFFYPAQVLAVAGLKVLLTREVAKHPEAAASHFVNASVLVVGAASLSFAVVTLLVVVLGYSRSTALVILLACASLLPYALSAVSEGIFQAFEQMHLIAYAQVPANVAKAVLALALLSSGLGLTAVVTLMVLIHAATMVAEWVLLIRRIGFPRIRPRARFMRQLITSTGPFLGIDGLVAMITSVNVVILSQFVNERGVGVYSAAMQLLTPIALVVTSTVASFFPVMSRTYQHGARELRNVTTVLLGLLLGIAVPAAVALAYAAERILLLIYRDPGFLASAVVVRILVWSVLCMAASAVLGQALVAANRERTNVKILSVDALVGVVLGLALISRYGAVGAAMTALAVQVMNFVLHYIPASRLLPDISVTTLLWKTAFAGACMGGVLVAIGQRGAFLGLLAALLVYATALLAAEVLSAGGLAGLRARYRYVASLAAPRQPLP